MQTDCRNWDATFMRGAAGRNGSIAKARPQPLPVRHQEREVVPAPARVRLPEPAAALPPVAVARSLVPPPMRAPAPKPATLEPTLASLLERSGKHEFRRGIYVVGLALGLAGTWAGFVPLSGAVVASGSVITASSVKKIQHPVGGVVRAILVHDGSEVSAGEVLISLDPTNARANLEIAAKRLLETRALIQRLTAERDGAAEARLELVAIPGISKAQSDAVLEAQRSLFAARGGARKQQVAMLRTQAEELQHGVESAQSQLASKHEEHEMVATELTGIEALYQQKLVTLTRLMALRRDKARLDGDVGALQASISESKSKISEVKFQIAKLTDENQMQVLADLREAQGKESELVEQHTMALEQLRQIDIRAPQAGVVHDLSAHTLGGVVSPAEVLMLIAPDDDDLQVETQLQPKDIDQVAVGQPAMLRFAAFDRNTTPELRGSISYLSPDTTRDPRTNAVSYTARISIDAGEARRLGDLHLMSGMPAEIYLITQSRTALTYLLKPLADQLHRMFRGR